ncbi:hypothetical protein [Sneathiella sp.]|uniref:DUF6898 family protein n=1 Tax=Sneathiella sp. TaxID=1964365 RepID=UPI0025DF499B|nr:hypothetical protein [Sneathiella sp.]
MASEESKGEYIVEFQQHGASVKVSVIDPVTMTEVSIVGPRSAGQEELQRAALAKLHYVMKKKAGGAKPDDAPAQPPQKKPGIIV